MSQTRALEWLLASMMFGWGVGLTFPGDTMDLPQYRLLGEIASEPVWAAWSLTMGAVRFGGLYINGAWRRSPLIRAFCSGFGALFWIVLTVCFFQAQSSVAIPAGMVWPPILIGFELYSVTRGMADAYHSSAFQKATQ